jgi:NAD(P)H-hydrate epimerase
VTLATDPQHAAVLNLGRPELMCRGIAAPGDLEPLLARADVVAVGPGLGQGDWGRGLLQRVLRSGRPLVVDADALNLLAQAPQHRADWVLTPHPGEAARLLGVSSAEIQQDRFAAARGLAERYGGTLVLKGAGTLIQSAAGGAPALCSAGNPGMASGGMGDLLTGLIAALAAQGLGLELAATMGVCLHAAAGDLAAMDGERGLLASDLLPPIRRLANQGQLSC